MSVAQSVAKVAVAAAIAGLAVFAAGGSFTTATEIAAALAALREVDKGLGG